MKNELKLNVDEQQDAIKHLKESYDTEPTWKDKAVCVTCNQQFAEISVAKYLNKERK